MNNFALKSKLGRASWQVGIWRERNLTIKNILIILSPIILLFLLSPYFSYRVVKYSANPKMYSTVEDLPIQLNTGIVLISDYEDISRQIMIERIDRGVELIRKNRVENLLIVIDSIEDQEKAQDILKDKNITSESIKVVLFNSVNEMCDDLKENSDDYLVIISNRINLAPSIYNCSSKGMLTNGLIVETNEEPDYDSINIINKTFMDVLKINLDLII